MINKFEIEKYLNNGRIIFTKIIDLVDYQSSDDDINAIISEGKADGFLGVNEIENFLIRDNGKIYGYVETKGSKDKINNIGIENLGANENDDYVDDCLVVFVTLKTLKICGYYKNARVYRKRQHLNKFFVRKDILIEKFGGDESNYQVQYNFEVDTENAVLLNKNERINVEARNKLKFGQNNTKYIDVKNRDYANQLLFKLTDEYKMQRENDYNNFFNMFKFWIEQINNNNNKDDKSKLVKFQEIKETNIDRAISEFKNPQFYPEYLDFSNFSIRISFFRTGQYKGEAVNFIVSKVDNMQDWLINIRYDYNEKKINVSYRSDIKMNSDSLGFKEYMKNKRYDKDMIFLLNELDLSSKKPNDKVKQLFDYFEEMIEYAKQYVKVGESNMKVEELADKLVEKELYNIILRGAPGTGKTYLAREIAAKIIGVSKEELSTSDQYKFVQFHPSYDYTDFVEGLRPMQENGVVGFEPRKGTFRKFCDKAKSKIDKGQEKSVETIWDEFIKEIGDKEIEIKNYSFHVNQSDNITFYTPGGKWTASLTLDNLKYYLEYKKWNHHATYKQPIFDQYLSNKIDVENLVENDQPYVFVIDEINRGEISKIFGELFFAIDPDYRGVEGTVTTQYANLFDEDDFYIPKNVYIIGTMNDIDRSVDTFDFAMRRRFTFEKITVYDSQSMINNPEIIEIMDRLNESIVSSEIGLSSDYQIGASYFKDLDKGKISNEELWNNKLKPLLEDYFRGDRNVNNKLDILKNKYEGN